MCGSTTVREGANQATVSDAELLRQLKCFRALVVQGPFLEGGHHFCEYMDTVVPGAAASFDPEASISKAVQGVMWSSLNQSMAVAHIDRAIATVTARLAPQPAAAQPKPLTDKQKAKRLLEIWASKPTKGDYDYVGALRHLRADFPEVADDLPADLEPVQRGRTYGQDLVARALLNVLARRWGITL